MFDRVKPRTQITVRVSAGGRALRSNEYELSVEQKPQGDAPPMASNLWCVQPFCLAAQCVRVEHLSYR